MEKEKLYQLAYAPQKDVTVWELAQIIALNLELSKLNNPIPGSALEALDPSLSRHYSKVNVTDQFEKLMNASGNIPATGSEEALESGQIE